MKPLAEDHDTTRIQKKEAIRRRRILFTEVDSKWGDDVRPKIHFLLSSGRRFRLYTVSG
jgi:hypothetical protein